VSVFKYNIFILYMLAFVWRWIGSPFSFPAVVVEGGLLRFSTVVKKGPNCGIFQHNSMA